MAYRILATVACALVLGQPLLAQAKAPTRAASTETFQISKPRIDRALAQMVASGRVAGASALIWKNGREVYFGTAGYADREAKKPMRRDTLVQIWSMTKPVTGVALMQLWEQGRFGLDEPLAKYLPEFADVRVVHGTDSAGNPILKAPERPILIRDLVRHTAGFAYGPGSSYPEKMFEQEDPLNLDHDLAEFSRRLARVPLLFEPGTQWRYSPGVDVQARLVEKLTGEQYEPYVRRQILEPLEMHETAWTQPESRYPRLAAGYTAGPDGKIQRKTDAEIRRFNFTPRKLTMGGAGLASTLDDYMRFARMLLNRGSLDGVRVLKPSTVKLMSTDQLEPRMTERAWLPGKGSGGWGIDFFVRTGQPKNPEENRGAVGEFFWDGAWTTLFWVDPANDLAAVFFVQRDPFDGTLHHDIRRAVYGDAYLGPKGD
ncbi:MAG: serine hydrolase domain-containing protein [Sphingomicrobium sp.]